MNYLMGRYGVGNRQACRCVKLHRSMYFYRSPMNPLTALRQRARELAHARVRFGYRRIYMLLRREGQVLSCLLRGKPRLATQAALEACVGDAPSCQATSRATE